MRYFGRRCKDNFRRGRLSAALLLTVSLGLVACEENLPTRDHFDVPFSMYGVLSPDLSKQSIRVYPLEDYPTLGSPEPLEVDVISTDLQTGEQMVWTDTVLVDPNGQHEYIFWAPFRAEFGRRYRVEAVRRSDGARSFADVRIPPPVTVRIDEQHAPSLHVLIEGEDIRVLKPEVEYAVRKPSDDPSFLPPIRYYMFSQQGQEKPEGKSWRVIINMIVDYDNLRLLYFSVGDVVAEHYCHQLELSVFNLHVVVGDTVWNPPGGFFDPNVVSFPHTLTNVENGFGFVGAGYRIVEPLRPSRESVELACFAYVW